MDEIEVAATKWYLQESRKRVEAAETEVDEAILARDGYIVKAHQAGFTLKDIADIAGVSKSRVHQVVQGGEEVAIT
jgi:hypothetical protein